jgi:large subunit ribosomal protein L6
VGYRAEVKGETLNLQLGFSHPVEYQIPEGVSVATEGNNVVVISGANRELVGQVAADIRSFRPPEPYKGKGIRYSDERIIRKEAKKK